MRPGRASRLRGRRKRLEGLFWGPAYAVPASICPGLAAWHELVAVVSSRPRRGRGPPSFHQLVETFGALVAGTWPPVFSTPVRIAGTAE